MADLKRSGSLAGGVKVTVDVWMAPAMRVGDGHIEYLGTMDSLMAVGALTPSMMESRKKYRKGDARGLRDDHGNRYFLRPSAIKAEPGRVSLRRYFSREISMEMPGVRELFPEGIPEPEKESSKDEPSRADFCTTMLNMIMQCARGDHPSWPKAMPSETQCLIERHIDAIRERFRCNGGKRSAPRPSFLRLVVDNTHGDAHGYP